MENYDIEVVEITFKSPRKTPWDKYVENKKREKTIVYKPIIVTLEEIGDGEL